MALEEVSCSFAVVLFGSNPTPNPQLSYCLPFYSHSLFFSLCSRYSPAFASLRYRGLEPKKTKHKIVALFQYNLFTIVKNRRHENLLKHDYHGAA
jgi:hypothetical protein